MPGEPRDLKTKIVCTVGPSTKPLDALMAIATAGMDVARINSGHTTLDGVREYARMVKKVDASLDRRIVAMLDLQGPRLRTGPVDGAGIQLEDGQALILTGEEILGNAGRVSIPSAGLAECLKPGDTVMIDEGMIRLQVEVVSPPEIRCRVVSGGVLKQGKGVNIPGVSLNLHAVTERDHQYLEVALQEGIEWISQSFVRSGEDVRSLRKAIDDLGYSAPIMAKIEAAEAVRNIDSILEEAQGIMVARGDLGVEMNVEEVPLVQKELIAKGLRVGRPVVTATQMLESMIDKPRPTRAEASDIANAVLDGTDALMLSAETAIGVNPVRAIEVMCRIAARAERSLDYDRMLEKQKSWPRRGVADSIGYAACKIASDLHAAAIVTITRSGYTARMIARYRPEADVLAVTPSEEVASMMSILWGVKTIMAPLEGDVKETLRGVVRRCKEKGFVESGDLVVVISGLLDEKAGTTNSINVHTVE